MLKKFLVLIILISVSVFFFSPNKTSLAQNIDIPPSSDEGGTVPYSPPDSDSPEIEKGGTFKYKSGSKIQSKWSNNKTRTYNLTTRDPLYKKGESAYLWGKAFGEKPEINDGLYKLLLLSAGPVGSGAYWAIDWAKDTVRKWLNAKALIITTANDFIFFVDKSNTRFIMVSKTNLKKGYLYKDASDHKSWMFKYEEITLTDPEKGPKAFKAGRIIGKVLWDDPQEVLPKGGFNIDSNGDTSDVRISLFYSQAPYDEVDKLDFGSVTGAIPDGTTYNAMSWDEDLNKYPNSELQNHLGLFPGRYKLQYAWANPGTSCKDGVDNKTEHRIPFTNVCKLSVRGIVTFEIDKEGYITIDSQDSEERDSPANHKKYPNSAKKVQDIKTADEGINILLKVNVSNPLAEALGRAILWMIDAINGMVKYMTDIINDVLDKGAELETMQPAWLKVRNIVITLLLFGLIIIAFANVLSVDIETYGLQRMIPQFVLGVVLTYFSFLIVVAVVEAATVLQTELTNILEGLPGVSKEIPIFEIDTSKVTASEIIGEIGAFIFIIVLFIALFLVLVYLALVLIARIVILKFLVVMAPIALILGIMPFLENLKKQWWDELFKWAFMGPAVMGMLLVGSIIISDVKPLQPGGADFLDLSIIIATAAAAYFMAATIPLSMGGEVMKLVDKGAKGLMKMTPGYKSGAALLEQRKKDQELKTASRGARLRAGIGKVPGLGRAMGYRSKIERQTSMQKDEEQEVVDIGKSLDGLNGNELTRQLRSLERTNHFGQNNRAIHATVRKLADNGDLENKRDADHIDDFLLHKKYVDQHAPTDNNLFGSVLKDNAAFGSMVDDNALRYASSGSIKAKEIAKVKDKEAIAMQYTADGRTILHNYTAPDMHHLIAGEGNQKLLGALRDEDGAARYLDGPARIVLGLEANPPNPPDPNQEP